MVRAVECSPIPTIEWQLTNANSLFWLLQLAKVIVVDHWSAMANNTASCHGALDVRSRIIQEFIRVCKKQALGFVNMHSANNCAAQHIAEFSLAKFVVTKS